MRKILFLTLTILVNLSFAQTNLEKNPVERKGFVIGLGIGGGTLTLNTNDTTQTSFAPTLPNIKVGYMLNERLALLALLP
ncbi:MAG: hypothetical protein KDE26_14400, partial [Bacteroidetes bacterium]|nr:hypothetical protein [Bacteroidota bacterium]